MPALSLKIAGSGVRGVVGESLTPQLVTSFCAAFGNYSGRGLVLVGVDNRPSATMVQQAAFAGLLSVGATPVDVGVVPTPALMLHVRQVGAVGGICISGRESAIEWNELRLISAEGRVLRPNQAAELTDLYHQGAFPRVGAAQIASVQVDPSSITRHRQAVLAAVDVNAIRARRFRVAIDCRDAATAVATPAFLEALGCQLVRDQPADVGFVQDSDGDSLTLIDERGRALPQDAVVALCADHWLARKPGPVVVTVATSRMVEAAAARHRCPVIRVPVGETHVVGRMRAIGAEIGGEGNGGVVLAPVNPCRDGYVAMALVLEAMATCTPATATPTPLSERAGFLGSCFVARERLLCPAREIAPALRWLEQAYRDRPQDSTDGLQISWPDRWLHVRPSSHDPVIRVTAEAGTQEAADQLLAEALEHLSPAG